MVCRNLPSPKELPSEKAEHLMCSKVEDFDILPPQTQELKSAFLKCDSGSETPTIVFISKMFPVERKNLPENKPKPLTSEELAQRRELARLRHEARIAGVELPKTPNEPDTVEEEKENEDEDAFVAFARVFSGSLSEGQELYVLGPKHDPSIALRKVIS